MKPKEAKIRLKEIKKDLDQFSDTQIKAGFAGTLLSLEENGMSLELIYAAMKKKK